MTETDFLAAVRANRVPLAICRECADPLDVRLRPDLSPHSDPEHDFDGPDPFRDPAVSGWWVAIPILAAVLVLGFVIGRVWP